MITHAPKNYICPICLANQGQETDQTLIKQTDLVFQDELVKVWVNSFWIGKNKGHLIVVPNQHFESIYDLPQKIGSRIFSVSKIMAIAIKNIYQCDGITFRQNNEPAGDQHAFHYHLHIFPRYHNDQFNQRLADEKKLADPSERKKYAVKLVKYLAQTNKKS